MQVSFNQVKAITDTLPIGLYAERRIDTELKEKEKYSYYNPETDSIVISYECLTSGFDNINENADIEILVRSMFYHEVSHAILTPPNLRMEEFMNIFEDERIETVLNGYYYGTDFEKTKKAICGYDPTYTPKDSMEAFFYLVRFRQCSDKSFLNRVEKIIEKYAKLHRASDPYPYNNKVGYYFYYDEVYKLYKDFCKLCEQKGIPQVMGETQGEGNQGETQNMGEQGEKQDELNENANAQMTKGRIGGERAKITNPIPSELIKEVFAESLNNEFNGEFHSALSMLFENFKKKNSKGSCLQGYSGIINPRIADRVDYRFFERSTSARGNNQFGTFHLNLFIDISGSFDNNETATNQIIKSLCLLEKKNPNFTFDIITTNTYTQVLPKGKRFIHCGGGTYLGTLIEEIYRKQQKPQTYNYNIEIGRAHV